MPKGLDIRSFLSIQHAHGDLWKHLGIDSSTDPDDLWKLKKKLLTGHFQSFFSFLFPSSLP